MFKYLIVTTMYHVVVITGNLILFTKNNITNCRVFEDNEHWNKQVENVLDGFIIYVPVP